MDERRGAGRRARPPGQQAHRFRDLLHVLLHEASLKLRRRDFLAAACTSVLDFSSADQLELRLTDGARFFRCKVDSSGKVAMTVTRDAPSEQGPRGEAALPEKIWNAMMAGRMSAAPPHSTRAGSLWMGDTARPIVLRNLEDASGEPCSVIIGGEAASIAFLQVPVGAGAGGVLHIGSLQRDFFTKENIPYFEVAAETMGVAFAYQKAQLALRERVKELTCLYGIARATQRRGISQDELFQEAVELLPPGWQYPEITRARIVVDGKAYCTPGFETSLHRQSAVLTVGGEPRGVVEVFYSEERPVLDEGPFLKEERNLIDGIAEMLGVVLTRRWAQWALGERVKELTCLYGIARMAQRSSVPEAELLQQISELLPPAWQYPEVTSARIVLDGRSHAPAGFRTGPQSQTAEIVVAGRPRGVVEVFYLAEMPPSDEGPFLREERSLIDEVARQVGILIERREAERERARIQEQLRHADRLATIGQLAAGTAHELNEPLGSVLGFAELLRSGFELPPEANDDVGKIVQAALHAREVVRKLLLFGRQVPAMKTTVNLNDLVRDGLYFLESRCEKEGIRLIKNLASELPEITADPAQMHQVLVNLVVNAIQAMPTGGAVTVTTLPDGDHVTMVVEDTGTGMTDEVLKQLFVPFFTTKAVGQGTGLGLSVVHGIVTSHRGTVDVRSDVGKGARFEVRLPIASHGVPEVE